MSGIGEALAGSSVIAGLLSLGIEVAKALYAVADGIGIAGQEVREVALEVEHYTNTMDAIQDVLERQKHISPKIMAVIERLVHVCQPIFETYHSLQKGLAPLLERFRDSKKKLEQVGLRLMWYLRSKKKVYSCRATLKRQFALLAPLLAALFIDQRGDTAQSDYYVQSVQVRVILENSAVSVETLHRTYGKGSRQLYVMGQHQQGLLPVIKDSGESKAVSDTPAAGELLEDEGNTGSNASQTTSTIAVSNSQSALVRYQPPGGDEEYLSPEELDEIHQDVERTLDRGLESVADDDIEDIILETYSVEKQFLLLIQQILASLTARNTGEGSKDTDPTNKTHGSPTIQPRDIIPGPEPEPVDPYGPYESWITLVGPDGKSAKFPPKELESDAGIVEALRQMGFQDRLYRSDLVPRGLAWTLSQNELEVLDADGVQIFPRFLAWYIKPGMKLLFHSTHPTSDNSPSSSPDQYKPPPKIVRNGWKLYIRR
ncbi:hypothetical protein F5Y13DRAFT_149357 [Hypoxylon sp. FL1857]|nr:hypothetical protein F5Y13DRAFT_149357 [Hypoxylon sp. FL1857]